MEDDTPSSLSQLIAAYRQSTNGQAERYVQILKKGLKLNINNGSQEIVDEILMAHRSTPSSVAGVTPAKLFLGREMLTRLDAMKPNIEEIKEPSNPYKNKYRQSDVRKLEVGDMIQMRYHSNKTKWKKGCIMRRIGAKMYEVRANGKFYTRHIDQLMKIKKTKSVAIDCEDDWFYDADDIDTKEDNTYTETRRYPERIRRPPVRLGIGN